MVTAPELTVLEALLLAPLHGTAAADLAGAGIVVLDTTTRADLVRDARSRAPHVVVLRVDTLDDALLQAIAALAEPDAPDGPAGAAVAVFVDDEDSDRMAQALAAGVHAYELRGWAPERLRPVLQQACVRARLQRAARDELQGLRARWDERTQVDRAKGILMQARQITEDEAFAILRSAAMHGRQRVGQVSQQLIATAGHADAINRAGQLRMLSQCLVRLLAQLGLRVDARHSAARLGQSRRRGALLLDGLRAALPEAQWADALRDTETAWQALLHRLDGRPDALRLAAADAAAERLLDSADRLVEQLQREGTAATLKIVNLCGRQRMLSQRLAKQALLAQAAATAADAAAASSATGATGAAIVKEFDAALQTLRGLPLSTPDIRRQLDEATVAWQQLQSGAAAVQGEGGRLQLAQASERLLELLEQLTERYEHHLQVLMA